MKIKGREVIKVSFTWTLDQLAEFMEDKWDTEEFGEFQIGKPTPLSMEEYILLPATPNCLVIAYARKGKIIFSVADNSTGAVRLAATAVPTRGPIAGIYQASMSVNRTKEMKGPAAEVCEKYAENMKKLLAEAGLM